MECDSLKQDLVKTTIRIPRKQKELLERKAVKSGVSQSQYISNLLTGKALAVQPPDEFWEIMDTLYSIHDMLLRAKRPEFTEAARRLEQTVVDLQAVFTAPRKEAS